MDLRTARRSVADALYPIAAVLLVVAIWEASVVALKIPRYLLPAPMQVAERLFEDWGFLLYHSWVTVYETLGGFLLSVALGIPLAVLIVSSRIIEKAIMPLLVLSQTFPKVAVAPLIVIWFGLGILPKLLVSFLVAFFPIVISTVVGLRSLEAEMIELARSMRASHFQFFLRFRLPYALPNILAGMKVAIAFAIVGAVIGEWVGSTEGLGYLLLQSNASMDTPLLFSILFMLTIIGAVLYYVIEISERALLPWHVSIRLQSHQSTM